MKKFICIVALLALLSGCVVIDSRYTGRSRMRIYNDVRTVRYHSTPLPYVYYYGYPYWYGGYYTGYGRVSYAKQYNTKVYKKQLKKSSYKASKSHVYNGSQGSTTKSKETGTRIKKK